MSVEIPDKLYFKIGEVSKLASVAPHVLRFWEGEFNEIQPKRANSNQRLYRRDDVKVILQIKSLLHEQGYTISGARKYLSEQKKVRETLQAVTDSTYLKTIKKELLAVKDMLQEKS